MTSKKVLLEKAGWVMLSSCYVLKTKKNIMGHTVTFKYRDKIYTRQFCNDI